MGAAGEPGATGGRRVVFCVTGGIAAYKVVQAVRDLVAGGVDVRVVMTASAPRFAGPDSLAAVSGHPVTSALFDGSGAAVHVGLARAADLIVVAPATANALAKMALGIADDVFSATLLMARCPVLVAPAMHTEMWEHAATRAHVQTLRERGAVFCGPVSGPLLSGDDGPGRMAEPEELVAAALALLRRGRDLAGRHVVVSAGGTQEAIDPVRFVGNRSSGLMGFAVARAALERGARVTLVSGAVTATPPAGASVISVGSAQQMQAAIADAAADADAVVMAAAVADFRPDSRAPRKLRKADGPPEIRLVPTTDILAHLGSDPSVRRRGTLLVGFAAETTADPDALARAGEDKRASKDADIVVANDVASSDSGFGVRTNRAVITSDGAVVDLGLVSKDELAQALLDHVAKLLGPRRGPKDLHT